MDGLGPLIGLVIWGLASAFGASKRKQRKEQEARDAAPGSPPAPPRAGPKDLSRLTRRAEAAVVSLEGSLELAQGAEHDQLEALLQDSLEAARALKDEIRRSAEPPQAATSSKAGLAARGETLTRRAALLRRLVEARCDPATGELMRGLSSAVEAAVPDPQRRVLVHRGGEHERESNALAGTGLLSLALTADPRRHPEAVAALIEDAWAEALLGNEAAVRSAMESAAEEAASEDAMARFASGLAQAWAPALLLDAACTLSLGGGHAARVRALAAGERPDELFVLRLDANRRVDGIPPAGLRLMLLRRLLERNGGPEAPPLPPNPVLQLRGPGVWDQVDLRPVLEQATRVMSVFADRLASRPGLGDPVRLEGEARSLLEEAERGELSGRPDARALFAALGLAALTAGPVEHVDRLLRALSRPVVSTRAARISPRAQRRAPRPTGTLSRRHVLAEAILLGESLSGPRT